MAFPLRPRSATELVDAAFQILRAHYATFVMCSAIAYLPWLLVQLVLLSDPATIARIGPGISVFFGLGIWLVFALMSCVLTVCASQAYLGEPVDAGAAVRRALPRVLLVVIGAILRYVLMLIGAFALFVGALYPAARFFAVTPAIVLEGASIGRGFSRSSVLSKDRKWHVIFTMGLVFVIYMLLAFGIQLAALLTQNMLVEAIITAVFTVMVYPVVAITGTLLYYDCRIRSEGLDIELMAGSLDASAPEAPAAY
ncbi:MAG TPA: hypothetical protein VL328_05245 [Gemmatimonadaceae bacterium]|jgi:hypothetical protein|nr:hypothetical protein [Gemmatimonadaceae bacterium]